jgi:hypothetical protein
MPEASAQLEARLAAPELVVVTPIFVTFRRETQWQVGYDHRRDPAMQKYGCHGMNLRFLLHGPKATIQFVIFTGWLPTWEPHDDLFKGHEVLPADLGYHADKQQYSEQSSMKCDCRPAGVCFYDGSGLSAYDAFKIFVSKGEEAMWKHLEDYYMRFEV